MSKYILITEAALDFSLSNEGFTSDFLPKTGDGIRFIEFSDYISIYYSYNEPTAPYFALINTQCLNEISLHYGLADDVYRRIARVVKGFKSPPIHLPRQWSEYHCKNLIAFFSLPKSSSTKRWIADLHGSLNGIRFDYLSSSGTEIDLAKYTTKPLPNDIEKAITSLSLNRFQLKTKQEASPLAPEVDLKAIGSSSITNNRTYEEWTDFISLSQKDVLNYPIESSIRILGPAGSGKTLALCMRAVQLSRDPSIHAKGKKILIATHSWAMAERIDGVISTLNGGLAIDGIVIFPLLSLLELHAGHIGQQRTDIIGDDSSEGKTKSMDIIRHILSSMDRKDKSGVSEWILKSLKSEETSRTRAELIINLYDEISGILTASGVSPDDPDSIRQYINGAREDWMPPFNTTMDRGLVVSIYRSFIQELIDRSSITTDQFVLDSIRVLETFTWRMRKETDGYDYIMVDELQLFDPQERSALELLGRSKKGVPFITAEDPSQGVFSALNTRPGTSQNKPVYLDTVHRFNKGIFDLISFMYQKFPLNTLPLRIDSDRDNQEVRPNIYMAPSDSSAIELVAKLAREINDSASINDRVCIATLGDIDSDLAESLEKQKLAVTRLAGFDDVEQLSYSKRSIIVAPWQFIGGTQFSHVIVVAAAIASPQSQFSKLRELISIYLSCSRAATSLNIVCSNYTPMVIEEAKDNGLLVLVET
ncbi:UvrD-helicase domain-containing protein [Aeromonas hydrophila]|uniref:UvrD-helicase domain-containing protein n=1 Tax=Aeromonas hydrophila TaxID=644 RepID=UPI000956BE28|nr:UvrD-helicase domain-containing protein [Aeromonas hydrophila]SIQ22545.1 UvrD/REP helicase N-terminal domain-containing protein [Aeromonas hydrophila]SIQ29882.1 UvrD/REP helicase N-terminal domain-containing protein [Aeromonas hydrophila]